MKSNFDSLLDFSDIEDIVTVLKDMNQFETIYGKSADEMIQDWLSYLAIDEAIK